MTKETNYVYDEPANGNIHHAVSWDGTKAEVIRQYGCEPAYVIETYGLLSVAIWRVRYFARNCLAKHVHHAMEIAERIEKLGPKAAHKAWLNGERYTD